MSCTVVLPKVEITEIPCVEIPEIRLVEIADALLKIKWSYDNCNGVILQHLSFLLRSGVLG